jgi:putative salt-induced outer membrane protein YdiY
MKRFLFVVLFVVVSLPRFILAADPEGPSLALPATPFMDIVTLKDGSIIYGEVVEMDSGLLQIKSVSAGDIIKIKWSGVSKLKITHPIPFHLKEGTVLVGTVEESEPGTMSFKGEPLQGTLTVPMDSVVSINPLIQPHVIYVGNLTGGFTETTGNSHLRQASFLGEFVGRGEQLRLTLNGRYVYGDNANILTARNARGTIKLDFFITKRLFWFASSYFESDRFQDLRLRTALSSGPGYQFIDRGDFSGQFKDMTLYMETGLSYFNEDFRVTPDRSSFRARYSMKFSWPLFDERITIYHYDEFYPSLQNVKDYYLTMDNGVRFTIVKGFVSSFQITTRYNSKPAPGTGNTDNLYLITVGYAFDTTRKRS